MRKKEKIKRVLDTKSLKNEYLEKLMTYISGLLMANEVLGDKENKHQTQKVMIIKKIILIGIMIITGQKVQQ